MFNSNHLPTGNLSAAVDIPVLEKYKISHILTVDTCPLPRNIISLPHVNVKFLQGKAFS